jgi:tetratricopeptide (TPR) repeat protein
MSKKRKRPAQHAVSQSIPPRFSVTLEKVAALTQRKRWAEAQELLTDLDRRFPQQPAILIELVNVSYELKDTEEYQYACERLLKIDPINGDVALALAGAYMANLRPALALRAFQNFLQRFSDHPRAGEARQTVVELESMLGSILRDLGLSDETGLPLAALHEEMQADLNQGKYAQVYRIGEELLRRSPNFAPALNNISLAYFADGKLERAIECAQRVLSFEPANIHALSNLIRFLCISGRWLEARQYTGRLIASQVNAMEPWLKKIEAFSFLGDDAAVLDIFAQAEQADEVHQPGGKPYIYHLVAAAELRLGHESAARQHWRQALEASPGLKAAKENLDDLRRPIGARHGPWAYELSQWLSPKSLLDLKNLLGPTVGNAGGKSVAQAARRFLQIHPEMLTLLPVLLERSDPDSTKFVVALVKMSQSPELLAALKDFALGQRGSDSLRFEAARIVSEAGLLPSGPVKLWAKGEQHESLLLNFEISPEPVRRQYSTAVDELLSSALHALQEHGDATLSETLLKQALQLEPDAPDVLNNLAATYEFQGRAREAETLTRQIFASHPDYFFARVNMARFYTRDNDLDQAEEMLTPLMSRRRLHTTEFVALAVARIELCLARDQKDGARSWFDMLESIQPQHPATEIYRRKLFKPTVQEMLRGRHLPRRR